jgi:hypothetical protein
MKAIGDESAVDFWNARKYDAQKKKEEGNKRLMECTHRYEVLMHCLGEASTNMCLSNFTQT